MLPTKDQFIKANGRLQLACNETFATCVFEENSAGYISLATLAIKDIAAAAALLGYEMVQRVTPAARDGGRMEMPDA